jgi:hypothetical protein
MITMNFHDHPTITLGEDTFGASYTTIFTIYVKNALIDP